MFIRVVRFIVNIRDIVCGSESQVITAYRRCLFRARAVPSVASDKPGFGYIDRAWGVSFKKSINPFLSRAVGNKN